MVKEKKVAIYSDKTVYMISPKEILFIRAVGSYCTIVFASGKSIRVSKNMKTVMSFFEESRYLLKIHRSYCVNIKYINNLYYTDEHKLMVLLKGSQAVPVSLVSMTQLLSILR
jgi:DNA-binding LytR/AlgR family response regulator